MNANGNYITVILYKYSVEFNIEALISCFIMKWRIGGGEWHL